LFGAAEARAQRSGLRRDSADAAFLLPRVEHARAALGQEAARRAEAEGARWSYEDALRFAGVAASAQSDGLTPG
jgi:hypothetical protein